MKKADVKELYLEPIEEGISIECQRRNRFESIYKVNLKQYLILEREYEYHKEDVSKGIDNWEIHYEKVAQSNKKNFIVDMNGIDNFISAKDIVFSDSIIRNIIQTHVGLKKTYNRFGVSGSRKCENHDGGEVIELQKLDFKKNKGSSYSVSGAMSLPEREYSVAEMLSEDGVILRDERTVYSHTAWVENINNDPIKIKVESKRDNQSVLDFLYSYCKNNNINATAIKLSARGNGSLIINGRVLKHIPEKPFKKLQEATDIAIEKQYILNNGEEIAVYGTLYKRYEPQWKLFTKGHQYEKRGHYHGVVFKDKKHNAHEVFHVRDLIANERTVLHLEIYPINKVYRIYPLEEKNNHLYISSFKDDISNFIENFYKFNVDI
ncbi:hypothetical protein SAMN04487831_11636 [Pseudobutyrivibrio sp. UC1225]|uniref:hypothetical protein n=1 Tax=Pseudobutyrivibrio sp. UC1225 TaxID=1798185 RepID=UPI0008EF50B8|nr:hypothetical protein [Pseudobutyrivibrio sp. UC1225]SFO28693.1 hypothetical protein SAMN04487831_11636 [Pseudobutyrivibrio sp. UC1225]